MNETTITTISMGMNPVETASALQNGVLASYKNEGEVNNELSDRQQLVLYVITIISGLLSTMGSSLTMYNLLTEKKKRRRKGGASNSLKRILIGLCCTDIVMSLCWVMQGFLVPRETSSRLFAIGNSNSCTAMGFMQQFSMSAIVYNASLSIYYLCIIRLSMKETMFAKRIEPILHTVSILFPLGTAAFGAIFQLYGESVFTATCYFKNNPTCVYDNDELEELLQLKNGNGISILSNNNFTQQQQQEYVYNNTNDIEWLDSSHLQCQTRLIAWVVTAIPVLLLFFTIIGNNISIFIFVQRTINRGRRKFGNTRSSKETERIRQVAIQSFFYVFTYLISYIWLFCLKVLEAQGYENEADFFVLLVLASIFFPLQGFNNAFVYMRPRYLNYRKKYKMSILQAMKTAIFGSENDDMRIPPSTNNSSSGNHNNNNNNNRRQTLPTIPSIRFCNSSNSSAIDHHNNNNSRSKLSEQTTSSIIMIQQQQHVTTTLLCGERRASF